MRTILLAIVLAAAPLAGCTLPDLDDLRAPAPQAVEIPWSLTGCNFAVAVIAADPEAIEPHLPKGFRPLTFAEIGLPPDPRGGGNVGVELWECQDSLGLNGTTGPVSYAATFSFVEPPPNLQVNGSAYHFYKWDVLMPDPALRQALNDAEAAAFEGNASFSQFQSLPQGGFRGSIDMNGTYGLEGTLVAPGNASMQAFNFTELTRTPDGYVWYNVTTDAPTLASGTGRVSLPGGTLQSILGSSSAQAYFLGGIGGFPNATITLPPKGPA